MESTTIHLMRHGEVENPNSVLYGRLPGYGLTVLGEKMAEAVADYFVQKELTVALVVSSPLLRAQQTALPTAKIFCLPIESDPRLVEATSKFQGVAVNKNRWVLAHPKNWKYYRNPHRPSWGEPYLQIVNRMSAAISDALDGARGQQALLVSHQLPIVCVQRFLEGLPLSHSPLNRKCSLASLTSLSFQGNTLVGWSYEEPAKCLLGEAQDMVPGKSEVKTKR